MPSRSNCRKAATALPHDTIAVILFFVSRDPVRLFHVCRCCRLWMETFCNCDTFWAMLVDSHAEAIGPKLSAVFQRIDARTRDTMRTAGAATAEGNPQAPCRGYFTEHEFLLRHEQRNFLQRVVRKMCLQRKGTYCGNTVVMPLPEEEKTNEVLTSADLHPIEDCNFSFQCPVYAEELQWTNRLSAEGLPILRCKHCQTDVYQVASRESCERLAASAARPRILLHKDDLTQDAFTNQKVVPILVLYSRQEEEELARWRSAYRIAHSDLSVDPFNHMISSENLMYSLRAAALQKRYVTSVSAYPTLHINSGAHVLRRGTVILRAVAIEDLLGHGNCADRYPVKDEEITCESDAALAPQRDAPLETEPVPKAVNHVTDVCYNSGCSFVVYIRKSMATSFEKFIHSKDIADHLPPSVHKLFTKLECSQGTSSLPFAAKGINLDSPEGISAINNPSVETLEALREFHNACVSSTFSAVSARFAELLCVFW